MLRTTVLLTLFASLTACSINQIVEPVNSSKKIDTLCIKQNDRVLREDFLPKLESQIRAFGIKTSRYGLEKPSMCIYSMEYTANWSWDMAMYLVYANMRVYENDQLVGSVEYDARSGSGRMDKFGETSTKINPLIKQLFAKY